jgi:hypothetical protein
MKTLQGLKGVIECCPAQVLLLLANETERYQQLHPDSQNYRQSSGAAEYQSHTAS